MWTGKCSQGLFLRKGVDLEWVSYTPLHLKSNPLLIPLLHKEWSVPNPIHSLPWSWVWSGVSRIEPVSAKNDVGSCVHFCLRSLGLLERCAPRVWKEVEWLRHVCSFGYSVHSWPRTGQQVHPKELHSGPMHLRPSALLDLHPGNAEMTAANKAVTRKRMTSSAWMAAP